jgi:hypothetical protein
MLMYVSFFILNLINFYMHAISEFVKVSVTSSVLYETVYWS